MLKNFETVREKALGKGPRTIAVAAAADGHTMEALKALSEQAEVSLRLVGDSAGIAKLAGELSLALGPGDIIDARDDEEAAAKAVALARSGGADILMKGKLQTATLLKAVLNRETGIRQGGLMSHLTVLESPGYHKLMFVSDCGFNTYPDAEQKKSIVENAVAFMHRLGYESPNVAALAAVETVSEKMPETEHAARLVRENAEGRLPGCTVEGPLSFDLAFSPESARIKGVRVGMTGEADLFLMPNIAAGNITIKAVMYLGGAKMAGCILGAKVPIVLTSRGASAEEKFLSFLLTLAVQ